MKYLLITLGLMITSTQAFTTDDLLHPVAHAGATYFITHAGTVVCKKLTGMGKLPCSLIAGSVAMSLGAAVELEQNAGSKDALHGLMHDGIGVGLAIGVMQLDF